MTYETAKDKGTLLDEKNGCELYRVDEGPKHHFFMHSPITGDHSITKMDSLVDDRIKAHWNGFVSNQQS